MKSIYIYGASGHGLVVGDIASACGYEKILFIDDNDAKYPSFDEIDTTSKTAIIVAVGDNRVRSSLYAKIERCKMNIVSLIHPSAIISKHTTIQTGTVIMPLVVINARTSIGKGCIINSSSIIEHENTIGDFVHISPGVSLAGNIDIANYAHIGIGSVVRQGLNIGEHTLIGAGSVVVSDIPNTSLAYGNPCKVKESIHA